jgi:hypothetical protein
MSRIAYLVTCVHRSAHWKQYSTRERLQDDRLDLAATSVTLVFSGNSNRFFAGVNILEVSANY